MPRGGGAEASEEGMTDTVISSATKEVVIGGSHIISPSAYIHDVAALHPSSIAAMDLFL